MKRSLRTSTDQPFVFDRRTVVATFAPQFFQAWKNISLFVEGAPRALDSIEAL
jgi:hypothetical protein